MKVKLKPIVAFLCLFALSYVTFSRASTSITTRNLNTLTNYLDTGSPGGFDCPPYILDSSSVYPTVEACRSMCTGNAQSGYQAGMSSLINDLTDCLVTVRWDVIQAWGGSANPTTPVWGNFFSAWDLVSKNIPEAYNCINLANINFDYATDEVTNMWVACDGYCDCL